MHARTFLVTVSMAAILLAAPGCAVTRGLETAGAYVDDVGITATIKARFVDSTQVSATAIGVQTMNGIVVLSGVARTRGEKVAAEEIARSVNHVKLVRTEITIAP